MTAEKTLPRTSITDAARERKRRGRTSVRGRLVSFVLGRLKLWRMYGSEQSLKQRVEKLRSRPLANPPVSTERKFTVASRVVNEQEIFSITPALRNPGRVLFLPGGGYVQAAIGAHWQFVEKLAESLSVQFIVPRYPLAPEHTVTDTMSFMLSLYRQLLQDSPDAPLVVMGDSAGGGLALALTQEVQKLGLPTPVGLVLISPWLDGTMSQPGQIEVEKVDPVLRRAGLHAAATWYAGSLSLKSPWVSPLYGPLDGVPPILMFGGGHDVLATDARRLVENAAGRSPSIEYHEVADLFHDWPLVPIPEAAHARRRIVEFTANCLAPIQAQEFRGRTTPGEPLVLN